MNQKYVLNINSEFAEQCRKALEKHYGGPVPMPKNLGRKANSKKKNKRFVNVAVLQFIDSSFAPMRRWITEKNAQIN